MSKSSTAFIANGITDRCTSVEVTLQFKGVRFLVINLARMDSTRGGRILYM